MQLNRGEQEVNTAASRLVELIEEALTVVPQRLSRELDSLLRTALKEPAATFLLLCASWLAKAALRGKPPIKSTRLETLPRPIEILSKLILEMV